MNETKRNWGRVALYASVAGAMVVSLVPFGARQAAAQPTTRKLKGHVCRRASRALRFFFCLPTASCAVG